MLKSKWGACAFGILMTGFLATGNAIAESPCEDRNSQGSKLEEQVKVLETLARMSSGSADQPNCTLNKPDVKLHVEDTFEQSEFGKIDTENRFASLSSATMGNVRADCARISKFKLAYVLNQAAVIDGMSWTCNFYKRDSGELLLTTKSFNDGKSPPPEFRISAGGRYLVVSARNSGYDQSNISAVDLRNGKEIATRFMGRVVSISDDGVIKGYTEERCGDTGSYECLLQSPLTFDLKSRQFSMGNRTAPFLAGLFAKKDASSTTPSWDEFVVKRDDNDDLMLSEKPYAGSSASRDQLRACGYDPAVVTTFTPDGKFAVVLSKAESRIISVEKCGNFPLQLPEQHSWSWHFTNDGDGTRLQLFGEAHKKATDGHDLREEDVISVPLSAISCSAIRN